MCQQHNHPYTTCMCSSTILEPSGHISSTWCRVMPSKRTPSTGNAWVGRGEGEGREGRRQ